MPINTDANGNIIHLSERDLIIPDSKKELEAIRDDIENGMSDMFAKYPIISKFHKLYDRYLNIREQLKNYDYSKFYN